MGLLRETLEIYFDTSQLILVFGSMVLAVMLFLLTFFTYVVGGAGFIRYADFFSGSLPVTQLLIFVLVGLIGLFSLSFLSASVTLIVKLKRSLDDVGFMKLMFRFPKYLFRLMVGWAIIGLVSFLIGLLFNFFNLPSFVTAFSMLLLWAFFIFLPQSLILKELGFLDALRDSSKFCTKKPLSVIAYYFASVFLLLFMVIFEVILGQFRVYWFAVLLNSVILFLFVIPFLEILKAELYVTNYKLMTSGLK